MVTFVLVLMPYWMNSSAQIQSSSEYQLKAVFLYNFTHFVEWPKSVFKDPQSPFIIGIIGEDPFGVYLSEVILNETSNGHPLMIKCFRKAEDIADQCQILFVKLPGDDEMKKTILSLKGKSILTVSDVNGFAKTGGMIQFVTKEKKIHLQINLNSVKLANLTINSKLLNVAEIVSD